MMVGAIVPAPDSPYGMKTEVPSVEGTGFLIANGRGLGITARHVAEALRSKTPSVDQLEQTVTEWPPAAEVRVQTAGFIQPNGQVLSAPIMAWDLHPTEDVALFRLPDDQYYSPYSIHTEERFGSAEYSLWGYPDDVRYDLFAVGNRMLSLPLVYSAGHIRRQVPNEIPVNTVRGCTFYELSTPAGSCASGSPVSLKWNPTQVIGVYVGERRNETNTFSVGYATRSSVIAARWPALVGNGDMSQLCPLPEGTSRRQR